MAIRLEVFETAHGDATEEMVVTDSGHFEELKLASFEEGYTAGWEDAFAAHSDEQSRIRDELARSLQGLSFTYHEAREHVLRSVEGLLMEVTCKLLPGLARAGLGQLVVDTLRPLMADAGQTPIAVVLHPSARAALEGLLPENQPVPLHVIEEPTLSEGQAYIRFGQRETRIDLDQAAAQIKAAMEDFFVLEFKETDHG